MSSPLVTVLMPVYNTEKYLKESIESVLNQTFCDFEFLIIDDGSTDNSVSIVESYDDKRIHLEKNEKNLKLIATLNKGLKFANGKYICRADADDINLLNRVERQVEFMEGNEDYAACATAIEIFYDNSDKKELIFYEEETDEIRIKKLYQNHFPHPASFIRKSVIDKNGLCFDSNFIHSEDYIFFVKLSEIGKMHIINQPLVKARKHLTNVSHLNAETQKKNSVNIIKYQLERIGIDASSVDFNLYFKLFYRNFNFSKNDIEIIEKLILDIIQANCKSKYLPVSKLTDYLCNLWFHVCVNSSSIGMWIFNKYSNSVIKKRYCQQKYNKTSFFIRALIKF